MRARRAIAAIVTIATIASLALSGCTPDEEPLPTPTADWQSELLRRHMPIIVPDVDDLEPEAFEVLTEDPRAKLVRKNGDVITSAAEQHARGRRLLDCIRPVRYCTGESVRPGDAIRVTDHRGWGRRADVLAASAPVVYGRVVEDADRGALWLVYILFWVYDWWPALGDSLLGELVATLGGDLVEHEGDLEAVLLRLNDRHEVEEVVLTQHDGAESRPVDEASVQGGRVRVFPSFGKHAGLFWPRCQRLGDAPVVECNVPGEPIEPTLSVVTDQEWADWTGDWGDGPASGPLTRWDDPYALLQSLTD